MATSIVGDKRDLALVVGYIATDWSEAPDYQDYVANLADWEVEAVKRDDVIIGAIYRRTDDRGTEVHGSILPYCRKIWATRGLLRQIFAGDDVFTRVIPGHEYMHDILSRIGFDRMDDGRYLLRRRTWV